MATLAEIGSVFAGLQREFAKLERQIPLAMNQWVMNTHRSEEWEGPGGERFLLCAFDRKPWPCEHWTGAAERNAELRQG